MEIVPQYGPGGIRRTAAITSGTTVVWDLSAFIGRYVELYADQPIWFGFAAGAADALTVSGEVAGASTPGLATLIGRPLAAATFRPVFVHPSCPYLQVRAQSTNTGLFLCTPASDATAVYR
jgi:hypothetical protein